MAGDGSFKRQQSRFRDWVSDEPGARFPAARSRYHLFVSLAYPWAHRAIIVRHLKGLEDVIGMSIVDPIRDERGWALRQAGFATAQTAYEQAVVPLFENLDQPERHRAARSDPRLPGRGDGGDGGDGAVG
jgi:glutathionyl-hydroquinone reductase